MQTIMWEPGELSSADIRRVIRDGCADLWRDSWRRDALTPVGQVHRFAGILEAEIYAATGKRARVELLP